ncbi:MAG: HesA/MoeB/ThiF family protein [Myxococcota bacterium]
MTRAVVIGAGGLGCAAALALAKVGAELTLVDPDRVDATNLHRQLLHRVSDVGRLKVESAADRLREAFPSLVLHTQAAAVGAANAERLFSSHDVVIDGTDGVATKFLLSDAAVLTGVPLVYGGVVQWRGQAMRIAPGGPCLRCLFEAPPPPDAVPTCAQAGVLGSMAGVVGGLQAHLALEGEPGGLYVVEGHSLCARVVTVRRAEDCRSCAPSARAGLRLLDEEDRCAR